MGWLPLLLLVVTAVIETTTATTTTEIPSEALPLEARNGDISGEDDVVSSSYVLPNQIFNDGKPYYARQDPVSGQLDFSAKKPAGIEPEANEVVDPNEKIILSGGAPNIHDYLNLPVKYSSSKFVYPLVSSSYANLKYQGSNKNYVTNKKPTLVVAQVTPPPSYHSSNYFTVPTTKLTAVPPTASGYYPTTTTAASIPTTTTTTTTSTTTTTTAATTTRPRITHQPPTSTRFSTVATTTTGSTRRPIPIATTYATPPPRTSTTRRKFIPTKKYSPTVPTTTLSTTEAPLTTRHPTPQAPIFPTEPTTTTKMYKPTTTTTPTTPKSPVVFTEDPTAPPAFSPIPGSTRIPNLDVADIYQTLGQKNTQQQQQQQKQQQQETSKPPMTLGEIFNSLVEEEAAVASNYQKNQGLDAQGNLMEPIAPKQPSPFAATTTDQKVISGSQENLSGEYVSYQVQQPNVMQYRPKPGQVNNVVISPGQQSTSFVLSSQQQVDHHHHHPHLTEPLFANEKPGSGHVQYGHVINEDIANINRPMPPSRYPGGGAVPPSSVAPSNFHQNGNYLGVGSTAPAGPQAPPPEAPSPYQQLPLIGSNMRPKTTTPQAVKTPQPPTLVPPNTQQNVGPISGVSSSDSNSNQDTKELLVSTNIRFPANDDESAESAPIPSLPSGLPHQTHQGTPNGHAQPLSLQQLQNSNPVVFPKPTKDEDEGVQIQQHEVVSMQQHKQQLQFPVQRPGMPSTEMEPPPVGVNRPPFPQYNELNRNPAAQPGPPGRPNLPNILPQFRPNAKISSGHPPNYKQEAGNIRLKRPYNPSAPPQFAHRRQPMQQQSKRYPTNRISEYPLGPQAAALQGGGGDVNRRIYRLPPYGQGQGAHYMSPYGRRPGNPLRAIDKYPLERHAATEPYKTITADSLADFEEEDLVINDPPQPVSSNQDATKYNEEAKLEPVVTLQMLHSQKKATSPPNDDTGAGEIQVTADNDPQETTMRPSGDQPGPYVVFPMKSSEREGEIPSGSEYQNTPFSIIRDQPQEPILKNKKPQSLQQQTKNQPQASKERFPYPIEKPDPSYTELHPEERVPGVLIAPRIINGGEAPIAIAYTPTEPSAYRRNGAVVAVESEQKFSNVNLATSVISEIRPDTQTEEGLSTDFDLRTQNFEKNFMAPFYPSVSLGNAVDTPPNNWNILQGKKQQQQLYEKSSINRADVPEKETKGEEDGATMGVVEGNTEKSFELDSFQPELQGGFKPIYPPGYKHVEQVEKEGKEESNQLPMALPLVGHQTSVATPMSSSSTSSSSSTTTTTPQPAITTTTTTLVREEETTKAPAVAPEKSTFETSLAALLFGDDEETEEGARKSVESTSISSSTSTSESKTPPQRNVPRMGPRNLKLR